MIQLNLQIDNTLLNRVRSSLGDMHRRAPQAISGAINETLQEAKTDLSRRVREILNLPKKNVDSRIALVKSRPNKLGGEVRLKHEKRPGLFAFGAREVRTGVSYKLKRSGSRQTVKHAFIAKKRGQAHENVFIRAMVGGKRAGRYPLRRLMGLSPWAAIAYPPGVVEEVFSEAQQAFEKNIQQRIDGIIGGHVRERRAA